MKRWYRITTIVCYPTNASLRNVQNGPLRDHVLQECAALGYLKHKLLIESRLPLAVLRPPLTQNPSLLFQRELLILIHAHLRSEPRPQPRLWMSIIRLIRRRGRGVDHMQTGPSRERGRVYLFMAIRKGGKIAVRCFPLSNNCNYRQHSERYESNVQLRSAAYNVASR